jgi:hypothetical protein
MKMTPEEIFNQQVWEILQDIKEEILATVTGKPVKYIFPDTIGVDIPPNRRRKILYKLEEIKTFEILRNPKGVRIGTGDIFYLIINSLRFDEVYKEYDQLNNPIKPPRDDSPVERSWNLLNSLKDRCTSFFDLPEREFFLGIADYIKYIIETPELEKIAQSVKYQQQEDEKRISELEKEVIDEAEKAAKELNSVVIKNGIESMRISQAFQEYWGIKEERIQSSATMAEALWGGIAYILGVINSQGHGNLVGEFIKIVPETNSISEYTFSGHYDEYIEELKTFRLLRETTVWGSWDNLAITYLVIHKFNEEILDPVKDIWKRMNFIGLHGEMEEIINHRQNQRYQFIQDKYKTYFNRVHLFFIEQLSKEAPPLQIIQKFQETLENLNSSINLSNLKFPVYQIPESTLKSVATIAGTARLTDNLVNATQSFNALGTAVRNANQTITSYGDVIQSAQVGTEILNQVQESQELLANPPIPKSFGDPDYQEKATEADKRIEVLEQEIKIIKEQLPKRSNRKMTIIKTKQEIKNIIKDYHFIGHEKKLLIILSDLNSHKIVELVKNEVSNSTNALTHMKGRVNEKLSHTNFFIEKQDGDFSAPGGSYQLTLKSHQT